MVGSPNWNGSIGAVTFVNGNTGLTGPVSASNSLVGTSPNDQVGKNITALTNSNYVVTSTEWNGSRGAATFGSGTSGITGPVSAANSLIGSVANDAVGRYVTPLTGGNYVVGSYSWSSGKGAVTFGSGTTGVAGVVSATNSFVGANNGELAGISVVGLTNGNYVFMSYWNGNRGALTFVNTSSVPTGTFGTVSSSNSLVGTDPGDFSSIAIRALSNGNYVFAASGWNNASGSVTLGDGTTGTFGSIGGANSLIGAPGDSVGTSLLGLTNGNYVVGSRLWHNQTGAVTFCNGTTGLTGAVSSLNSLVGDSTFDRVGTYLTALPNGNYVVGSPFWNGARGAVTFGNGGTGVKGSITSTNSLVGSHFDELGLAVDGGGSATSGLVPFADGSYVARNVYWDNGTTADTGAITFGRADGSTLGQVNSGNSVLGQLANRGRTLSYDYDQAVNHQLVVGRPFENKVTLFKFNSASPVTVSGRVTTPDGRGLRNATVSITDSLGVRRTATTSSFGFFSFDNVSTGQTYVIRVSSRLYRFSPVTVMVTGNVTLPDLVGLE